MSSLLDQVDRKLARMAEQLGHIARRGVLTLSPSDYFCQAEAHQGERYSDVELWQQFGFTSRPPAGAEVLLIKVGGRGEGAIAVATQARGERPTGLAAGDTWLYASGSSTQALIKILADGNIQLLPGGAGDTVDVGSSPIDYMLLGTGFDTALRTLLGVLNAAWAAAATAFGGAGTAFTALGGEGALSPGTQSACNTAGSACTAAGTAAVAVAAAMTTFLAGVYLATVGRVK